jgi:DNA-binding transcriptional LysR family regulator
VPTAAGERVLRHARRLVAQLEAAEAELNAIADGTAATLRVGTFQSVSVRVLPAVVRDLRAARPDVEIEVTELGYDDELLALLERGRLDLTFTAFPAEGPFEQLELLRDPHLLIVPEGSPLAGLRSAPSLREVGRLPLIGYGRSTYGIESVLRARGIEPDIVFRTDESRALQRMVGAGVGHALVPSLSIEDAIPGAVLLDASRRVPPRRLGLAWHRDITPPEVARAFTELVAARCATLQRELDARVARLAARPLPDGGD